MSLKNQQLQRFLVIPYRRTFNVPKKNYKQLRERPASNLLTFELTILNDNYGKFRPPPKSSRVMV